MYLSLLVKIFGFGCVEIGKAEATGGGAVGGTLIILELTLIITTGSYIYLPTVCLFESQGRLVG